MVPVAAAAWRLYGEGGGVLNTGTFISTAAVIFSANQANGGRGGDGGVGRELPSAAERWPGVDLRAPAARAARARRTTAARPATAVAAPAAA